MGLKIGSVGLREIVVVAAVLVAAVMVAGHCYRGSVSAWEDQVERVQRFAEAERARTQLLADVAAEFEARADSLAALAREQAPRTRSRIRYVRGNTPPELDTVPAVAIRDEVIDSLLVESDRWRTAFEAEQEANDRLREALAGAEAAADSLSGVLDDRPSGEPWWLPKLVVGPQLNTSGFDFGATLGWEIKL